MKFAIGIALIIGLLLTGCTRNIVVGPDEEVRLVKEEPSRVWPEAPSPPRIRFLHSIGSAADLGYKVAAIERFFEFVGGKKDIRMTRPYGIAVEGRLLLIADPGASALHFLDLKGQYYKRVSLVGATELRSPIGVAIGGERIFVSDSALNKVFVLDLEGELIQELDELERPTGLAFDPATQRLYVAETLAHRVAVFDLNGVRLFDITGTGEGDQAFNAPTHIAFGNDVLLINDTMNFRVMVLDKDGAQLSSFGTHGTGSGHFAQSKGVDIDSRGNIYVADAIFNRVQVFDQQGNFLLAFGRPGHGKGDIWLPAGVFVAGDQIFVADSHNSRVQVFEYVGGGVE